MNLPREKNSVSSPKEPSSLPPLPWKVPLALFLIIHLLLLGLAWQYSGEIPWEGWEPNRRNLKSIFNEKIRVKKLIRQPVNTWSNGGYLWVALIMFAGAWRDRQSPSAKYPLSENWAFSLFMSFCVLTLFVGSFFFHASFTLVGEKLDVGSIHTLTLTFLAYSLYRLKPQWKGRSTGPAWLVLLAVIYIYFYAFPFSISLFKSLPLVGGGILLAQFLQWRKKKTSIDLKFGALAVIFLGLAFAFWKMDIEGWFVSPTGVCQGHALWHFLTAATFYYLYLFYRSEKEEIPPSRYGP